MPCHAIATAGCLLSFNAVCRPSSVRRQSSDGAVGQSGWFVLYSQTPTHSNHTTASNRQTTFPYTIDTTNLPLHLPTTPATSCQCLPPSGSTLQTIVVARSINPPSLPRCACHVRVRIDCHSAGGAVATRAEQGETRILARTLTVERPSTIAQHDSCRRVCVLSQAALTESAEQYIASHPQLPALINDFLTAWQAHTLSTRHTKHIRHDQPSHSRPYQPPIHASLTMCLDCGVCCPLLSLTFQPSDVNAYARQYFSSFHPRAHNRPQLDGDMAALLTARSPREPTSGGSSDRDSANAAAPQQK